MPRPRGAAYKTEVLSIAWAIAGMLALAPAEGSAPTREAEVATSTTMSTATSTTTATPGRLVIGPEHRGALTVVDAEGRTVAEVALRAGRATVVELPAGRYALRDASGQPLDPEAPALELEAGQALSVELPAAFSAPAEPAPSIAPRVGPAVTTGPLGSPVLAQREIELVRRRPWARWVAPLLSAVIPGAGQAVNGQPGRGLAVFTGTAGLVLGTVALWSARDPALGAGGDVSGGSGEEIVRLVGLAGLSTAAGLLYLGQILDAHAQAVDRRPPRPARDHILAIEASRATTVGFSAGQPAYRLYSDWSLAIMGQVAPRVSVGLSDLSIKYARHRDMVTVQAGVRAAYRFYDRRRVWLAAGGGALLQGTRADAALDPLVPDPDAPRPAAERALGAVPYLHFDARLFLLDRWSLGLVPRVSLPLAARRYGRGLSLPRYAATFELAATMGVYF